jgi:GNAT superfamily N-acetyltransferase
MSQKLTDFSPAALARANRANLYEWKRHFQNSPHFDFTLTNGLARWSHRYQNAAFNAILCTRDASPADAAFIDDSLAYFKRKNTSEMLVYLDEGVDQAGWDVLLSPRGFKFEEGPPCMSVDLERLNENDPLPPGSEIKIVDDDKSVRDWAGVAVRGYGAPADWLDFAIDFLDGLGFDRPFRSYLAYWNGQPVSTAGVFFGEQVAGIYNVATVPEARGKGFGAAVTLAPLLDARKLGYRVGTLQSSEMGFSVYKRMGFEQHSSLGSFFLAF